MCGFDQLGEGTDAEKIRRFNILFHHDHRRARHRQLLVDHILRKVDAYSGQGLPVYSDKKVNAQLRELNQDCH
jgi:hypothetical protein